MESGEAPQTVPGGEGPAPFVPFEVVRRAEFVFEPFLGSLIQLPEVSVFNAQGTEYFLPQSPMQAVAANVSAHTEAVPEETALPFLLKAAEASAVKESAPIAELLKTAENRVSSEEERETRFFEPKRAQAFNLAQVEKIGSEEEEASRDEAGLRPTRQLPEDLKAAIQRIKEQRQGRIDEERQAEEKKHGLREATEKRDEAAEIRLEISGLETTKGLSRWEELGEQQTAIDPVGAGTTGELRDPIELQMQAAEAEGNSELTPAGDEARTAEPVPTEAAEAPALTFAALEDRLETPAEEQAFVEMKSEAADAVNEIADVLKEPRRTKRPANRVEAATRPTPPLKEESPGIVEEDAPRKKKPEKLPLSMRLRRWFEGEAKMLDGDRRRAERVVLPGLVAFYWSGGVPKPHEIVNISRTGFYLHTNDLWSVETLVRMTLQRPTKDEADARMSVSVLARVVRIDEGGVGHEFVTTEALMRARSTEILPGYGTNAKDLDRFLRAQ